MYLVHLHPYDGAVRECRSAVALIEHFEAVLLKPCTHTTVNFNEWVNSYLRIRLIDENRRSKMRRYKSPVIRAAC